MSADDGTDGTAQQPPPVPAPLRAACAVLGLECLALLVGAVIVVAKAATEKSHSLAGALLLASVALVGALALAAGARGLLRLNPAARTPILVIQLLALPVAYSLAFQAGRVGYGGPILLAAVSVIYLLFTPPARAALDREPR